MQSDILFSVFRLSLLYHPITVGQISHGFVVLHLEPKFKF